MSKWPLKYRIWRRIHVVINGLAWKYADPGGEDWGKALRIDKTKLLWRLNDWAGNHYTYWWATEGRKLKDKKFVIH